MSWAVSYILRVTAAALIAAILSSLAGQGTTGKLTRMLCGIFTALTVIAPLTKIEIPDLKQWFQTFDAAAEAAAAFGQDMADESRGEIITQRLCAYILDISAGQGVTVSVEVTLDQAQLPVSVTLTGEAPDAVRKQLIKTITENLGMEEGAVAWIEP